MEKEGIVSLWLGNFELIKKLNEYVEIKYDEDGDTNSKFETDFLIKYYDEDFREIDFIENKTDKIRELLTGFSYDDIVIKNFEKKLGNKVDMKVNSIILLYNFQYTGDVVEIQIGENTLKYMTTVSYRI